MRILYFHQHFSTPRGAGGSRSYEMARALVARGHEVHIVCGSYDVGDTGLTGEFSRGRRRGMVDGIEVTEFALAYGNELGFLSRTLVFLSFALRSIKLAVFERCDLIFATSTPLTAGIPGIVAKLVRRKPFVFEVRDLWPELPKAMGVITNPVVLKAMSVLEWMSYRAADACIGLSPGIVGGIRDVGPRGLDVVLVSNGCDLELFGDARADRARLLGIDDDDFVAIFTGAHGQANGLDAALDAARELKRRGRDDIHLVFIGSGSQRSRLIERARAEGLDRCHFHGLVPKIELGNIVKSADVGLMLLANVPAFYYGTSPNKFFDYLALGMPVLTNYPGWVASIIESEGIGTAVAPDSPSDFADALEHLAENRDALDQMGEKALQVARSRFDRRSLAADFVDVLERTGARHGAFIATRES